MGEKTDKKCGYTEQGKDSPCCDINYDNLQGGTYCRADKNKDCISTSPDKHFLAKGCCREATFSSHWLSYWRHGLVRSAILHGYHQWLGRPRPDHTSRHRRC